MIVLIGPFVFELKDSFGRGKLKTILFQYRVSHNKIIHNIQFVHNIRFYMYIESYANKRDLNRDNKRM